MGQTNTVDKGRSRDSFISRPKLHVKFLFVTFKLWRVMLKINLL